jgi:anaerobic selenocysteine-containing dehydrogenase
MGFEDEAFSWSSEEAFDKLIGAVDMRGNPVDGKTIKEGKIQRFDFPGPSPVQLDTVHPRTPDKKIDLAPPALGTQPYRYHPLVSGTYPLAFLTPASTKTTNSTFGEWSFRELVLTMHPRDAEARNIANGDRARVFNELGELFCKVLADDRVREGVVHMPKGAWMKTSENGQTATALCPDDISEVGGGACFNDARVEVEKA